MDKLDIKLGGHHFTGDDLIWMQERIAETIKSYALVINEPLLAIWGVDISIAGPTISWSNGWLLINGEICKVVAGSATLASNNTFAIVESFDADGTQVYEDLNSENPWVTRRAVISGTAGGANSYLNIKRLKDYLANEAVSYISMGTVLQPDWGWDVGVGIVPTYRLNKAFEVELNGRIEAPSVTVPSAETIGTLPVNYRPAADMWFLCSGTDNGTRTTFHVKIDASGVISTPGLIAARTYKIDLQGIIFPPGWQGFV